MEIIFSNCDVNKQTECLFVLKSCLYSIVIIRVIYNSFPTKGEENGQDPDRKYFH